MNKIIVFFTKQSIIVSTMIFFVIIFSFFSVLYISLEGHPRLDDHYFHVKYADILRNEGIDAVNNFRWVYFSEVAQNNDRYGVTLFHIMLIPFTYLSDLINSVKLVDAFCLSLAVTIIYFSLKKMEVKYAAFFAFASLAIFAFMSRFLLGRAFVIASTLIVLEVYFAVTKKEKALAIISALHVILHQSTFFMPFIVVSSVEVARYLINFNIYVKNFIFTMLAIIISMMFFPNFPMSIFDSVANIIHIQSQNIGEVGSISGTEVQKKDFFTVFASLKMFFVVIIFDIVFVVVLYTLQKKTKKIFDKFENNQLLLMFSLFILVVGFLFGSIVLSVRFLDFLVPVSLVLFAIIFTTLITTREVVVEKYVSTSIKYTVVIFCFIIFAGNTINFIENVNKVDSTYIKEAANWIGKNAKEDEVIFLVNWSDFNWMFFYNSDVNYTTGRDPILLKKYDEDMYWKYFNMFRYAFYCEENKDCIEEVKAFNKDMNKLPKIEQDKISKKQSEKIIQSIKHDFKSRFIVSQSQVFNNIIMLNPELIEDKFSAKTKSGEKEITVFKLR